MFCFSKGFWVFVFVMDIGSFEIGLFRVFMCFILLVLVFIVFFI